MSQDPELSPVQATRTAAEREQLDRYAEKLVRDIRSGATRGKGRFWTLEEFQRMADERQIWDRRPG